MDTDVLLFLLVVFGIFIFNMHKGKSSRSESNQPKKPQNPELLPKKNKPAKPTKGIKIIDKVRFERSDQKLKPTKEINTNKPIIQTKVPTIDLNEKVLILSEHLKNGEDLTFYYQEEDEELIEYKVSLINIFFKYDNNESAIKNKIWFLDAYNYSSKKNFKFLIDKISLPNDYSINTSKRNELRQKSKNYFSKNKKRLKKYFCLMCENNLTDHDLSLFKIFNDKNKESALPYETDGVCWKCFSYTNNINLSICVNCEGPIPEKRSLAGYNECIPCVEERERVEGYKRKVPDIK
jgi:hypothetical protein